MTSETLRFGRVAQALALSLLCATLCGYSRNETPSSFVVEMENQAVTGCNMPVRGRQIVVRPGRCKVGGTEVHVRQSTTLDIAPCPLKKIVNQPFILRSRSKQHPLYDLVPESCCAGGSGRGPVGHLIVPGSLKVLRPIEGGKAVLCKESVDYTFNPGNDSIESTGQSALKPAGVPVLLTYDLYQRRIDSIVVMKDGSLRLIAGKPSQFAPLAPKLPPGALLLANVLAPRERSACTESDIMVAERSHVPDDDWDLQDLNDTALAATKNKLKSGPSLKIAFVGDSVTTGCFSSTQDRSFPRLLTAKLQQRFPKTKITAANFAVGGSNSTMALSKLKGELGSFKPDLIVVEFVNDLTLNDAVINHNYALLSSDAKAAGASLIVCLPHLPAPWFLSDSSWDSTAGRAYYTTVRQLAARKHFGIADVASRWQFSYKDGLNPILLLADGAIHPNDRGHEIYAEELLKSLDANQ